MNDGTHTYSYDFEDHLTGSGTQSGQTATYAYHADGNRIQKIDGTGTTNYLVDTNRTYAEVLEERDASGNVLARYDYGDDLIRMDRGSVSRYYLFDGLGSTRQLTDGTGAVTDTYAYDAFGNLTAQTGSTVNPYLFNGQEQDAGTGLYYLRARYMDPTDGRFISQDPYGGDNEDPISLHRYLYASANPVNEVDPNGEDGELINTLTSIAIGVGLEGATTVLAGATAIGAGTGYSLFVGTGGNGFAGAVAGAELGFSLAFAADSARLPVAIYSAALSGFASLYTDIIIGRYINGKLNDPGSNEFFDYLNVIYQHMFEAAASGAASVALGSFKGQTSEIKAYIASGIQLVQEILDDSNSYSDAKDKEDLLAYDAAQLLVDVGITYFVTKYTSVYLDENKPKEIALLKKYLRPTGKQLKAEIEEAEITIEGVLGIASGTIVGGYLFDKLKDTAINGE